jgi:serine/threonine protein kinase
MAHMTQQIVCSRCSKRIGSKVGGSFTGWIFQENRCTCAENSRTKSIATQARLVSGTSLPSVYTSNSVIGDFGDRYKIVEFIGSGGMGLVYSVVDRDLDKSFAIKVLRSELIADKMTIKRFEQEAKTVATLTHPNLAAIHGQGRTKDGAPYLVMDLVVGSSVSDILRNEYCLDAPTALDVFAQVTAALAYAHRKGVVHRDLKPSNILICSDTGLVKVVDFGIAKLLPTNEQGKVDLTQTGDIFGSPLYMSPEQCQGDSLDARSDIYSMGCVMYETVCGMPPFSGANPVKVILAHLSEQPKRPSLTSPMANIPSALEAVILECLKKNPEERYQSMKDLHNDLNLVREGRQPQGIQSTEKSAHKEKPTMLLFYSALSLCLIGALVVFIAMKPMPQSAPSAAPVHPAKNLELQPYLPINAASEIAKEQILKNLLSKYIAITDVTDKDLEAFDQATVTQDVSITDSDLKGPGLAHLIHLPLRSLSLSNTSINARGISEIQNMAGLVNLNFRGSGITDSELEYIANLKKLSNLNLSDDSITSKGLSYLVELKNLNSLNLSGNNFSMNELNVCAKMPVLKMIALNRTNINAEMLQSVLVKLKNLRGIALDQTQITDSSVDEIVKSKLSAIFMMHTEINDQSLQKLGQMKSLRLLDVTGCEKISGEAIRRLREQNPNLKIVTTSFRTDRRPLLKY